MNAFGGFMPCDGSLCPTTESCDCGPRIAIRNSQKRMDSVQKITACSGMASRVDGDPVSRLEIAERTRFLQRHRRMAKFLKFLNPLLKLQRKAPPNEAVAL